METQESTATHDKPKTAEVFLDIEDEGEVTKEVKKDVAAGDTQVSVLKSELGVPAEATLWLVKPERKQLVNTDSIDVKSGMHFEAIEGGGIS
jgi:hypothetical protein